MGRTGRLDLCIDSDVCKHQDHHLRVPVAQLDKAPDYESGDWGFKSLQGYFFARH